jgi:hypothetical protein
MIKDALKSYEEKSQKLQVLRGQLANYLNEETKTQMINSMADIQEIFSMIFMDTVFTHSSIFKFVVVQVI